MRSLFPALDRVVWLNWAGVCPGAQPVLDALARAQGEWRDGTFDWPSWEAEAHESRRLYAQMIGVDEQDVALCSSLAEAASTVAQSLPIGRIVVGNQEFQSNLFPWLALRDRGFEVEVLQPVDGVIATGRYSDALGRNTVLVAVSDVQSTNGYRVELEALAVACRTAGARLFVNATQSLGVLRMDAKALGADYVAAHGYKWLLCPRGAAWLYVKSDHLSEMRPLTPNWKNVPHPYAEYYGGPMELADRASRLDVSLGWFSWVGAKAALELLSSLDAGQVEQRALILAASFRRKALARGLHLSPEEQPSHLLGVVVPDPHGLAARLAERKVVAAVRGGFLRLGFHAFNNEADVEAALEALSAS